MAQEGVAFVGLVQYDTLVLTRDDYGNQIDERDLSGTDVGGAEREYGSNAPVTRNIREQLRAEKEAAPSAHQQFLSGARSHRGRDRSQRTARA